MEQPIGTVTHYYSHLSVAVVQLNEGNLQVGDTIRIKGHTTNLEQPIESMEVDHQSVQQASSGQVFGLKVRDHVREHDQIYKG
ncbi:MAG: translation elongation factor-like protein [Nitrospirae bacterium]|nr:translation elongation factor-like protein [Candidatus Manganitrophaceae bacterium]